MKKSNRKHILFGILTSIISIIFVLLVLEISLRFFYPQSLEREEFDPVFKWRNRPGFSGVIIAENEKDFFTKFKINKDGFRGEELRENAKYKIMTIGDSFTFGKGVEDNETYSAVLEKNLNDLGYDTEVINTGVIGYYPDQYYLVVKKMAPVYKPNMIIIGFFGGNDIEDTDLLEISDNKVIEKPFEKPPVNTRVKKFFAKNSHLYNYLIIKAMQNPWIDKLLIEIGVFAIHYSPFFTRELEEYYTEENKIKIILNETIKEANKQEIPLIILYIPPIEDVSDRYYENAIKIFPNTKLNRYTVRKFIEDFGKQTNIKVVDPVDQLNEESYLPQDLHWNKKGHAVAASLLTNATLPYLH
ncbi:MAG: SGNH/GDSL hydrolase family protein [Candidatus Woesearchaeota archaeon]